MAEQYPDPHEIKPVDYERKDANVKAIIIGSIAGLILLAVAIEVLHSYFQVTTDEIFYQEVLKPESNALRELRAREDEELNSYGVVDSTKGTYRIPIDRAMRLVVDEADRSGPTK